MFGSWGLYRGEYFFGIISQGILYLKTSPKTVSKFITRGMAPFAPSKKQILKNYFEIPGDILEDKEALELWVLESVEGI